MNDFIEKYGVLIIIVLILALYSCNCRIDRLNESIEELKDQIEEIENDRDNFLDSHCLKNLSPYCIQYKADKKLIKDILEKVKKEHPKLN